MPFVAVSAMFPLQNVQHSRVYPVPGSVFSLRSPFYPLSPPPWGHFAFISFFEIFHTDLKALRAKLASETGFFVTFPPFLATSPD
jgi:hypothetical protein